MMTGTKEVPGGRDALGEGVSGRVALPADAQRALSERPSISIRARITLAFLLCFLLMSGIIVGGMVSLSHLTQRQTFLEKAGTFASEIQNARRFEKNFFLYGTNLDEALSHIDAARRLFRLNAAEMRALLGGAGFERVRSDLGQYGAQLGRLVAMKGGPAQTRGERQEIEVELRRHGSDILAEAQETIERERIAVRALMRTSMLVAGGALVFMLILMAYIARFLASQIVRPLGRFVGYTSRIAAGDYSPIYPQRKYRDEISDLAMAINRMLEELKQHQEQLLQSRKMAAIGSLTSGIAHELNNPLNNIGLTAEALLDGEEEHSDEQRRAMLEQIYQQVERASGTVRNLLDFTRKEQAPFTRVSVGEVLTSTLRLVQNEMSLGRVELDLELPEGLPEVRGNPRNLQQVFLNLFLNSIQAMPDGGRLGVTARPEGESVRVEVRDTGVGIPPENLDKVFDPFFTTKGVGEGTGLGLAVSYGIVEKHGGRIAVASESGRGTTFSVLLPCGGRGPAGREGT